jgi:hypothetical protein
VTRAARSLLLAAGVVLAGSLGFAAGRSAADHISSGVDAVMLSVIVSEAAPEWEQAPVTLLRSDGAVVVRGEAGYSVTAVSRAAAHALLERFAREGAAWADYYPMAGGAPQETTVVRLWGAHEHVIRIEGLFANPDVPSALLAAVGALSRLTGEADQAPLPPLGLRLSVAAQADPGAEPLFEPPPFDLSAADGRRLTGAEAAGIAALWPPIGSVRPVESHVYTRKGGVTYRLGWTPDWDAWLAGDAR